MTTAAFTRRGNALIPSDEQGRELLSAVRDGREVMVTFKPARNIRHHRLLFAMLKLIVERTNKFDSTENALIALKIACGLVDPFIDAHSGKTFFVPRSISFASMPQNDFSAFFDRATYVAIQRWFPPRTSAVELRAEIELMVAPNYSAPSLAPSSQPQAERVE